MRRGVSLLEVLVGMTILAVAGIAVVAALRQSAQEVDTTSDYTLALGLSQELMEQSLQAALDDPHLDAAAPFWGSGRASLRDGGHPRFAALEDTAPPWGRLDAPADAAIDARAPNLFRLYRDFGLAVSAKDSALPGVLDVSINLDCPGVKDARTFSAEFLLARAQAAPDHAPPVAQDRPGLDAAIRRSFFGEQGSGTLESTVGSADADLALVRDLGGIVVVLETAAEDLAKLDRAIADARPADPEAWLDLARSQERRTALAWRSLLWCREPAGRIAGGFTKAQIGGARAPSTRWISSVLRRAASLHAEIEQGAAATLASYLAARRALGNATARPFHQLCLERKVLELAKLRVLLSGGRDLAFVGDWVRYLTRLYQGRNRAVEEFLEREGRGAASLDALRDQDPVVATRAGACEAAAADLARLRERLP